MGHDPSYFFENRVELERLNSLINRLTDADLEHPLDASWTVSAVLAHLAFWDRRASLLIQKWEKEGITPSPIDVDVVNEANRIMFHAIPGRVAGALASASAAAVDQAIERLSPELAAKIEASGKTLRLNRALHRREHLDQIEAALGIQ
jgi:hypothetical protein